MSNFRPYNPDCDLQACQRIWMEVGWLTEAQRDKKIMETFLPGSRVLVAELNGEAECLVVGTPGAMRYQQTDLSLSVVTAVTTSRVARKQGLATRLTAQLIAQEAQAGATLSALGIFDQGFYNRLGYGSGSYVQWIRFNPANLQLKGPAPRIPRRLDEKNATDIHAAMMARLRGHGGVNIFPANTTEAEMLWGDKTFALGYFDGPDGELTHFFWGEAEGEHGPYIIGMMAYQTWDQFLELMGLIKNLGDQVYAIRLREPMGIQFQDLLAQPFKYRTMTRGSDFEHHHRLNAYWQMRICDLPACVEKTVLPGETVRFNLALTDPIADFLPADAPWRGVGGDYTITFGPQSGVAPGFDPTLPTLRTSVGPFTRLWLGVKPASGLAVTEDFSAPPALLNALDSHLCLPAPETGWDF